VSDNLQRITDPAQMNLTMLVCRIDTRDLNIGKPDDPYQCAAAKALNRRLKARFRAVVTQTDVWIFSKKANQPRFRVSLSKEMKQFVCNFDNGIMPSHSRVNFYLQCPKEFLQPHRNEFSMENPANPFERLFIKA
jgi:hypothetical protein|tara:strand:+ start:6185 stop:6589 length:405 start_codon:yes stop_codon:yes gene_type:complete